MTLIFGDHTVTMINSELEVIWKVAVVV